MKTSKLVRLTCGLLLGLLLIACAAPDGEDDFDRQSVVDEVLAFTEEWASSATESRWDDLKTHYAADPGFAWLERGTIQYRSHEVLSASIDNVVSQGVTVQTHVNDVTVTPLSADSAAVFGNVDYRFDFGQPEPIESKGVFSGLVVKREGRWQFLQGHISSPPVP